MSKNALYSTLTDIELLIYLKNRDRDAFDEIYDRSWKFSYNQTHQRVKDDRLTEEIVQNVFVQLWLDKEIDINEGIYNYILNSIDYQLSAYFYDKKAPENVERTKIQAIITTTLAKDALKKDELKN